MNARPAAGAQLLTPAVWGNVVRTCSLRATPSHTTQAFWITFAIRSNAQSIS